MDVTADGPAIIVLRLAPHIRRQMQRDPHELRIRQPEATPFDAPVPSETVSHTGPATPAIFRVPPLGAAGGIIAAATTLFLTPSPKSVGRNQQVKTVHAHAETEVFQHIDRQGVEWQTTITNVDQRKNQQA